MDGNNNTFAQTPANGNDLHLNPAAQAGLTEEQIENPQTGREYYLDSLAAILQENIGQPVLGALANSSSAPTILSGVTACSIPPA